MHNAILDRIWHHTTVVRMGGESYRIKHHLASEKLVKLCTIKQAKMYIVKLTFFISFHHDF